MKKTSKFVPYVFMAFALYVGACTQTTNLSGVSGTTDAVYNLNLGPKGGGTIDPKITSGQAIINFKEGTGVLLFNINLSGNSFSTKDAKVVATGANTYTVTVADSPSPSPSVTASPSPSVSPSPNSDSISKISNEIYINNKKYTLDIDGDKVVNNKYILNLTGLKTGDIVSLSSQVYDSKNEVVGKESAVNKQVTDEVASYDLNISLSININVDQKTEVNVNQSQVVTGPVINITLPTPAQSQQGGNNSTPPPPPPVKNASYQTESCLTPSQPDSTVKLNDGTTVKICRSLSDTSSCYRPDTNGVVKLSDDRKIIICPPKG